jgi:polysaccharide deacetylase family protein (PEP-CTERM system associated)
MSSDSHNKSFFLTLDLEEWYHLEYLNKYSLNKNQKIIPETEVFFKFLNEKNIPITVFVLGELIDENADLIKEIAKYHEIAIHGWNHDLLFTKTKESFQNEITKTKAKLENLIGKEVFGYRAPCFSMSDERLDWLSEIDISYDSSFIQFNGHPLYGKMQLNGFTEIDDLVYEKDSFYEIEIPTLKVFGKNIPISGGGYFRFFPRMLFRYLFSLYLNEKSNFNMYIHPFELTNVLPNIDRINYKDKLRFSIGRRKNLEKLISFLNSSLDEGFVFKTVISHIDSLKKNDYK